VTPADAQRIARSVAADPEAVAAWDVGLLDLPRPAALALDALLAPARRSRDWHRPGDVTVIGADDDR
jgi:hypothetical protein